MKTIQPTICDAHSERSTASFARTTQTVNQQLLEYMAAHMTRQIVTAIACQSRPADYGPEWEHPYCEFYRICRSGLEQAYHNGRLHHQSEEDGGEILSHFARWLSWFLAEWVCI
jgi:hypothetical protein